mgnify:CR=1 FL=1
MTHEERIAKMQESAEKDFQAAVKKYKDVRYLYEDYLSLIKQNKEADKKQIHSHRWSKEFLEGYLSCIRDLIINKKRN